MDVRYHEEFVMNPRGVQLFTCGWLPASSSPKALIFLCHGYGMECSDFMRGMLQLVLVLVLVVFRFLSCSFLFGVRLVEEAK